MAEKTLKEKTATGLLWGAVGNLSMQVLGALIGIVLARLLSPGEYGMVGMLAIFTAIAGTLSESGFTAAITNLKEATHHDYNAVFWFSTFCSLFLYVVLYFSAPLIAAFFHQPDLIPLSRLVFASFVFAAIGTAHAAWMFRNMMNREKAIINIISLIISGMVGITMALLGYSYWSLAWQQFAYIIVIDLGRLYYVRWLPSIPIDFKPICQMFGFSSKILVTSIVNQVNNNVLSFVFGRLYTPRDVGNYSQAAKWTTMGHSLISGTLQQVAQPVMASISDDCQGRQVNIFRKMLRFTAFLSMPAMLTLALVADFIVLLLGAQWIDSVSLMRILCISGAFLPLQTLYQNLFISHGRSDMYMWSTLTLMVIQLVIILMFCRWSIQMMVAAYATTQILWLLVWQQLATRLIPLRLMDIMKDILPFLLTSSICVAIAWMLTNNILSPIVFITLRVVIVGILYLSIMKMLHVRIFEECLSFFIGRFHSTKRADSSTKLRGKT